MTTLGYDTTGVEVVSAVSGLTDGDRDGEAAEYLAVEARDLAPMPATPHVEQAAAVPLAEGRAAFEAKRTPGVPGKIVLAVSEH